MSIPDLWDEGHNSRGLGLPPLAVQPGPHGDTVQAASWKMSTKGWSITTCLAMTSAGRR